MGERGVRETTKHSPVSKTPAKALETSACYVFLRAPFIPLKNRTIVFRAHNTWIYSVPCFLQQHTGNKKKADWSDNGEGGEGCKGFVVRTTGGLCALMTTVFDQTCSAIASYRYHCCKARRQRRRGRRRRSRSRRSRRRRSRRRRRRWRSSSGGGGLYSPPAPHCTVQAVLQSATTRCTGSQ